MIKVGTNMRSWDPIRVLVLVLVPKKGFHPWVGTTDPNPYYKNNNILVPMTRHKGAQKPPPGLTLRVLNNQPLGLYMELLLIFYPNFPCS